MFLYVKKHFLVFSARQHIA